MYINDIMTKEVVSLNSQDTVEHAAQLMRDHNIGAIPVCTGEKVVGIITDRDIALRCAAEGKDPKNQVVREVMSSNPVFGKGDIDIDEATRIMSERQIRRLPIVENGNLVGMVSLGDLAVVPETKNEAGKALSEISTPSTPTI